MITYFLYFSYFFNISFYLFCYFVKIHNFNTFIKNISTELVKINKFFGKIFQWQIQDNIFMWDEELTSYFNTFLSNVPYTDNDIDYSILNGCIDYAKNKNALLVIENDMKPINSGTVALVFKGKLNEKDIVIKLLRNNIQNEISNFINIVIYFLNIYTFFSSFFYVNNKIIVTNVKNNLGILLDQCDFTNEILNIDLFNEKVKTNKNIIIPYVYKEYTEFSNKIIIMDFLYGKNLNDLTSDEIKCYKSIVKTFIYNNYFTYKLIHSDLHIGNVIFMKNNNDYVLGVIDFGLVKKISIQQSNAIFFLFLSIVNNDKKGVFKSLLKLSNITTNLEKYINILYDKLKNDKIFSNDKLIDFLDLNIIIKTIKSIDEIDITKDSSEILLSFVSSLNFSGKFDSRSYSIKDNFAFFLKSKNIYCD